MDQESFLKLLLKYHSSGARYSCYPPPKFWTTKCSLKEWQESVIKHYDSNKGVDIYIHIPFCNSLCSFCGCNIKVTKDSSQYGPYLKMVELEWKKYLELIPNIKISSIYIGGGTPNSISSRQLNSLLEQFAPYLKENFQGTVELDPRIKSDDFLKSATDHSFSRVIIGVQDFSEAITKNLNRHQELSEIISVVNQARSSGISEVCLELIFGLPLQTSENIQNNLKAGLKEIRPEQLIVYPLANAPWQEKTRQGLGDFSLPSLEEKYRTMIIINKIAEEQGLTHIGMNSYLSSASSMINSRYRNITGFKTSSSSQLISLGNSAISYSGDIYIQNNKVVDAYISLLSRHNQTPISHSHITTKLERNHLEIFNSLTTTGKVTTNNITNIDELRTFLNDELITFNNNIVEVTTLGKHFLKPICQVIDPLL